MSFDAGDLKWGASTLGTPSGEITWSMDLSAGLAYDTSLYSDDDFEDAMHAAFDRWEEVAAIDFTFSTASDVDVEVTMGALEGSTVGLASYSYYPQAGVDQIIEASITMDSLETWDPTGDFDLDFYAVALHEIGHILGLGHVNDTSEIMNPYIARHDLGDGDIEGAVLLYGTDGSFVPPPPDPPDDEPLTFVEDEDPDGGDSGGGGGGGIGALIGLLGLLLGAIFGGFGGGAAVALAAARSDDDGDEPPAPDDGPLLSDLIVFHEDDPHGLFATEEDYLEAEHEEDLFSL